VHLCLISNSEYSEIPWLRLILGPVDLNSKLRRILNESNLTEFLTGIIEFE
jgi:hypothetical protein